MCCTQFSEEVWLKRLLNEKRNHHKDESVDHHEENELGIQSKDNDKSKEKSSNLEASQMESLVMKLRKLIHEESHHDDPHELKREDEWHRYRSVKGDTDEGVSNVHSYLDATKEINHLPHGNPALDGQHGRIDIGQKRVLMAGPEHKSVVHHHNSPHRDDHGERK